MEAIELLLIKSFDNLNQKQKETVLTYWTEEEYSELREMIVSLKEDEQRAYLKANLNKTFRKKLEAEFKQYHKKNISVRNFFIQPVPVYQVLLSAAIIVIVFLFKSLTPEITIKEKQVLVYERDTIRVEVPMIKYLVKYQSIPKLEKNISKEEALIKTSPFAEELKPVKSGNTLEEDSAFARALMVAVR